MEGGLHLQGQYTEHVQQLRRELQEAQHQRVLDSESGTASRQIIQRERAIHQRNLAEQAERWRAHSMEIYDEGRAAVSTQRQEILAERDIVNQVKEHLAETQAQVDDWNFWYDQEEYGSDPYEAVGESVPTQNPLPSENLSVPSEASSASSHVPPPAASQEPIAPSTAPTVPPAEISLPELPPVLGKESGSLPDTSSKEAPKTSASETADPPVASPPPKAEAQSHQRHQLRKQPIHLWHHRHQRRRLKHQRHLQRQRVPL